MTQELERNAAGLPVRELGNTGLKVSIIGFGGGHFARKTNDEQTSIRLVQAAIDAGVGDVWPHTAMDRARDRRSNAERRATVATCCSGARNSIWALERAGESHGPKRSR